MGNFNRRFGGGKSFGGGSRFGGRDGGRPPMHKAVCSECGDDCELPFRPTGDRPVFCSNCFSKQDNGGGRPNKFAGERRERPRFDDKQMHDAVCAKCGKDCQVPFRPTAERPVYCNDCFDKSAGGNKNSEEIMEQIKILNNKIDKIMKILVPNAPVEKAEKIEKAEKPEVKKEISFKEEAVMEEIKEKKEKNKTKLASKKVATKKKK